jgi:adenylosuccinate lyase
MKILQRLDFAEPSLANSPFDGPFTTTASLLADHPAEELQMRQALTFGFGQRAVQVVPRDRQAERRKVVQDRFA